MTNIVVPVVCTGYLPLTRTVSLNDHVKMDVLRARDRVRHSRILGGVGIGNFPVQGSADPNSYGLYTTKIKLGSPPKEFTVIIDTGSDLLWVNCNTCDNCPQSSGRGVKLNFFDMTSSSTVSLVHCSNPLCPFGVQGTDAQCSPHAQCSYLYKFQDKSATSGVYISDEIYFDTIPEKSSPASVNSSATVFFGPHYNLNLESIAVNGQLLSINPVVFAASKSGERGTVVDSGTTLAYLVEEAYDSLINAIATAVSQFATPTFSEGSPCYLVSTSLDIFPSISFNFAGGASMDLKPAQYLVHYDLMNAAAWCIGFQKTETGPSVLGDLVLKDKIVVYDLANQRIGWTNYDCSKPVNVSVILSKDKYNNPKARRSSASNFSMLLHATIVALLMHIM